MTPKISVIMPLYNRKHYVADAIDSVLNQTFQDFEFIIRDDGSTDGSFDFVAEKYSKQISSGKIKLRRNEKNLGEFPTDNRLIQEATGKYLMIIHSDDMYLSEAMEKLFELAEKYSADVVHSSYFLNSPPDGIINKNTKLKLTCWKTHPAKKIEVVSDNPSYRFNLIEREIPHFYKWRDESLILVDDFANID